MPLAELEVTSLLHTSSTVETVSLTLVLCEASIQLDDDATVICLCCALSVIMLPPPMGPSPVPPKLVGLTFLKQLLLMKHYHFLCQLNPPPFGSVPSLYSIDPIPFPYKSSYYLTDTFPLSQYILNANFHVNFYLWCTNHLISGITGTDGSVNTMSSKLAGMVLCFGQPNLYLRIQVQHPNKIGEGVVCYKYKYKY